MRNPEHISAVLPRAMARVAVSRLARSRRLAPLEPNAFLAFAWRTGPRGKGTSPLTVDDVWFELVRFNPELTPAQVRRDYVRLAAKVRRNQRLNLDPWEGIL
jgi:hypothetical protein